jgi:hypothetical protein
MAFNLGGIADAINQAVNAAIGPAVPVPQVQAQAQAAIPDAPLPPWILAPPGPPPGGLNPALPPLPPLPVTDPANAWQWDFATINAFKQAQAGRNKKQIGAAWLASEPKWKDHVGKDWKPVRVLGRGSQGIVGHWSYGGPDRHLRKLNDVAVKQAVKSGPFHKWGDGLETEARLLMLFQPIRTQHVVKMYRHMYEDAGQQTDQFDYGVVHRIFLEYCPGGDLSGWLGNYMNKYVIQCYQ